MTGRKPLSCLAWAGIGTAIVIVLGAIFHFVYEWSQESPAVQWFAATNESVWEHQKLLVFPHFIGTLLMYFVGVRERARCCLSPQDQGELADVWLSRTVGLLVSLVFVPAVFYAYTVGGQEGKSILAVDLLTFVAAAVLGNFLVCAFKFKTRAWTTALGVSLTTVVLLLFVVFSYHPPNGRGLFYPYEEGGDIA